MKRQKTTNGKHGHGGHRPGAGKKKGQGKKEPTIVKRIPEALEPEVDALVSEYKESKVINNV